MGIGRDAIKLVLKRAVSHSTNDIIELNEAFALRHLAVPER